MKKDSEKSNYLSVLWYIQWAIIVLLISLGITVRYAQLDKHFSHIDDVFFTARGIFEPYKIDEATLLERASDPKDNLSQGYKKVFIEKLHNSNLLRYYVDIRNGLSYLFPVSTISTSAPLQYFLTRCLIEPVCSYTELLFWGRFPSFLWSIFIFIAIIYFYKLYSPDDYLNYSILGIGLAAFSWQSIIYACQMSSYIIGVLGVWLMFAWLMKVMDGISIKNTMLVKTNIIFCILPWAQYQLLFFCISFLATVFIFSLEEEKKYLIVVKRYLSIFWPSVCFWMLLYILYLRRATKAGVVWNVGPSKEYLFKMPTGATFFEGISYMMHFFVKNTLITFSAMMSCIPEETVSFEAIYGTIFLVCIIGFIYLLVSSNRLHKALGLFSAISIIVFSSLMIAQKLTLSPTRHCMVFIPFFILTFTVGIDCFLKKLFSSAVPKLMIVLGITVIFLSFFLCSYSAMAQERKDVFVTDQLFSILKKNNADVVLCSYWTMQPLFMPELCKDFCVMETELAKKLSYNSLSYEIPSKPLKMPVDNQVIAFISHRSIPSREKIEIALMNANVILREKDFFDINPDHYFLKKQYRLSSDTQVCFSKKTLNGTNGLFIHIIERKK